MYHEAEEVLLEAVYGGGASAAPGHALEALHPSYELLDGVGLGVRLGRRAGPATIGLEENGEELAEVGDGQEFGDEVADVG